MSYLAPVGKAQQNVHNLSTQDRSEGGCGHAAAYNFVGSGPARVLRSTTIFRCNYVFSLFSNSRRPAAFLQNWEARRVYANSSARGAHEVLRNVAVGKDPAAELKAFRHGPTVAELCDEYEKRANGKKCPR